MAGNIIFDNDIASAVVRNAQANWIMWEARITPHNNIDLPFMDYMNLFTLLRECIIEEIIQPEIARSGQAKVSISARLSLEKFDAIDQSSRILTHYFTSSIVTLLRTDNLIDFFSSALAEINRQVASFTRDGSGWRVIGLNHIDINFARLNAFARRYGNCLLVPALPSELKNKQTILKVTGQHEEDCFYTAVMVAAYHVAIGKKIPFRQPSVLKSWLGLWKEEEEAKLQPQFPTDATRLGMAIDDIYKFENDNPTYRVLVLGYEKGHFYPLRTFLYREEHFIPIEDIKIITLFFHADHYYPVKSLSALLNGCKDGARKGSYLHYCPFCLQGIKNKSSYQNHLKFCCGQSTQGVTMPDEGATASFTHFHALQPLPFVIYADTESCLEKPANDAPVRGNTVTLSRHVPCSAAYYLSISPDMRKVLPRVFNIAALLPEFPNVLYKGFTGEDCMTDFLESLYDLTERLWAILRGINFPLKSQWEYYHLLDSASECYMCGGALDPGDPGKCPVLDHCHITGKFRGIAHHDCNAKASWKKRLFPVVFHNWRGYDCHSLCKTAKFSSRPVTIRCIPNTSEKYLSMSLLWTVGEFEKEGKKIFLKNEIRFIDSFQFLSASLDNLAKQLFDSSADKACDFAAVHRCFAVNDTNKDLFFRKGIFPYCYVDGLQRLEERALPPRENFKTDLRIDGECSQADYEFAQRAWREMRCSTLRDYMEFYLKLDVLLLADIFDAFRRTCQGIHNMDPVYFYSLPGYSWQAALKTSRVRLELLTDYEMHCFVESGIRGGLSVATRHFTETKPGKSAILTLDANSLYAWCMTQPLPVSDFIWMPDWEGVFPLDNLNAWPASDGETGYILDVDLEYPEGIHDETATYPLAPAKEAIRACDMSEFMHEQYLRSCPASSRVKTEYKLMATQRDKQHYPIHYRVLRLYIELGMRVKTIHRVMAFKQKAWLAEYIVGNIERRKLATTPFQSDFFKKCNNSVFGKTQENKRGRTNFRLTISETDMEHWIARPNYNGSTIFSPELVGVFMKKTQVCLDQPIYSGFTILDLSKMLMFEFFYRHLKPCFASEGDDIQVLYTDTDSLHVYLKTRDPRGPLQKLLPIRDTHLDGSNLPEKHVLFNTCNKGVMGMFKEEMGGACIKEHVCLRPKMYAILTEAGDEKRRAKGVKKDIINNLLTFQHYKDIYDKEVQEEEAVAFFGHMTNMRSHEHTVYTERQKKKCLSIFDNKRCWLSENASLPHGHRDTCHFVTPPEEGKAREPVKLRPPFRRRDMLGERRQSRTVMEDFFESTPRQNFIRPPTEDQLPCSSRQASIQNYLTPCRKRGVISSPSVDTDDVTGRKRLCRRHDCAGKLCPVCGTCTCQCFCDLDF